MKSMKPGLGVLMVFFTLAGWTETAQADLVFTVIESNGNVELSVQGEIDLAATQGFRIQSRAFSWYNASGGSFAIAGDPLDLYAVDFSSWTNFGTGRYGTWDESTGTPVALYGDPYLGVPEGYVSGTELSGSAIEYDATFESLGFEPGTYTTTLTNGQNVEHVIVNVAAVPEPSGIVLCAAAFVLLLLTRFRHYVSKFMPLRHRPI